MGRGLPCRGASPRIERIREAVGSTPLLFDQIAGGESPRLSFGGLAGLGVDVAIRSTPCPFAAHRAMDTALAELHLAGGRPPAAEGARRSAWRSPPTR